MLLTEETTDGNTVRIYATQQASVVTYFTDDGEGGTLLHGELGEFASPWSVTPEKVEAVKAAVLEDVARRLNCSIDKVLCRSMADLSLVTDPLIKTRHSWSGRRHSRGMRR
jgi:hypothetical protein